MKKRTYTKNAEVDVREKKDLDLYSQYHSLIELASDVIYTVSTEGLLTSLNPAFFRITGWKEKVWIGKHFKDLIHPGDLPIAYKEFKKNLRGKSSYSYELRVLAKNGEYLTGEFVSSPRIEGKKITGVIGIARDITKRKKAERYELYLSESTKLLASTFDYDKIVSKIASLFVPEIADWCIVSMFDGFRELKTVDILHKDTDKQKILESFRDHHPFDQSSRYGILEVIRRRKGILYKKILPGLIKPLAKNHRRYQALKRLGLTSLMIIPFVARGKTLGGVTLICSTKGSTFDSAAFRLAQELGHRIALTLDNAKLVLREQLTRKQTEETMLRIHKLQRVTSALSEAVTPKQVASTVLRYGLRALGATAGSCCILDRQENKLVILKIFGYEKTVMKSWKEIPLSLPLPLTDAVKRKEIMYIESLKELKSMYPATYKNYLPKNKSFVAAPFLIDETVVGALGCSFKDSREFGIADKVFLSSLINQCTIALERALLFEAEQKSKAGAEREIGKRKKIEDDLRQSEERFRSLVELAPDAIYSLSKDGRFTQLNPAFERITGWSRNEWLGKSFRSLVHEKDLEKAEQEFMSGILGKTSQPYELRIRTKSGTYIVCEFRSKPRIKDGKVVGKLGIFRDVTIRRQEERARDYMLGIASHELRTPLATIKAFSQLLKKRLVRDKLTEGYVEYVEKIDQHADKLTMLIGDMLDLTRIRAGRVELKLDIFHFDEMVSEVVSDILTTVKSHTISIKGKTGTYIQADRERISRVILNLLTNAVKYSPRANKVIIALSSTSKTVTVQVKDFGIGIPKETQDRIFEPFTHIVSKTRGNIPTVGLGLYISSQLVKLHGGKIWFESTVGQGTTFYVQLPLKQKNTA